MAFCYLQEHFVNSRQSYLQARSAAFSPSSTEDNISFGAHNFTVRRRRLHTYARGRKSIMISSDNKVSISYKHQFSYCIRNHNHTFKQDPRHLTIAAQKTIFMSDAAYSTVLASHHRYFIAHSLIYVRCSYSTILDIS